MANLSSIITFDLVKSVLTEFGYFTERNSSLLEKVFYMMSGCAREIHGGG